MVTSVRAKTMLGALLACLILSSLTLGTGCKPQAFPELSGPYLGQEPPGSTPMPFAPDVVEELHSVTVFSPDGTEVFWGPLHGWDSSGSTPHLMTMRLADGIWTAPAGVSFSESSDSAAFSPDGNRLYFLSRTGADTSERIWYADRTSDGWSAPTLLAGAVSQMMVHWQLSMASSGDLYFGGRDDVNASPDIYLAELVEGQYDKVTKLGPTINTDLWEYSPYVARDGSYLLFSRANEARTDGDLYVSFATGDGTWGEAQKLPSPINASTFDHCSWVSDDGKWLFFMSTRNGSQQVFWVDAGVIETLRPR